MGPFSTSVWALFYGFLWHMYLVFCCVDLYIRDSIPTFQNQLSSSTSLPKTPSPTEVWGLFTTVTPCNGRHHGRVPSQVITYSPSCVSAVCGLSPSGERKKARKKDSEEERKWKRRRKAKRCNITLCYISLATTSTVNALRRKWKSVHSCSWRFTMHQAHPQAATLSDWGPLCSLEWHQPHLTEVEYPSPTSICSAM